MTDRQQTHYVGDDCEGGHRDDATRLDDCSVPEVAPMPDGKHVIELDDYQVANLRSVIAAAGYWAAGDAIPAPNPLYVLNNGDWLGELWWKLPEVPREPNDTPLGLAAKARGWHDA